MKIRTAAICALSTAALLLGLIGTAQADTATAYVGSVHGYNAFDVQAGGSQLYFHPQPDTIYVWNENNGSAPGTLSTYTYQDVVYNRDGMKTFACTDVAYGQRLDSVKMQYDFYTGLDTTGYNMSSLTINFFITDGTGNYGIWSATSGGTAFTTADVEGEPGWKRLTLDMTNLANNTWGKMNEYNGGVSTDRPFWDDIKDWTIAGFYDYQRTPEGGFEAWNKTLWTDVTNVGVVDDTLNEYGIALNWGDTVGGLHQDGDGEIGADANRAYGQAGRLIKNYQLTVDGTAYTMTFEAGVVPEPGTLALLAFAGLTALGAAWFRRR